MKDQQVVPGTEQSAPAFAALAERVGRLERGNRRLLVTALLLGAALLLMIASCAATGEAPGVQLPTAERLEVVDGDGDVNARIEVRPGVSPLVRLIGGRSQVLWENNPSGWPTVLLRNDRFARVGFITLTPDGGVAVVLERDTWQVLDEDGETVF